ncbi:hypothetical protein R6242_22110 [Iodobacter sp. CM08]|uniref:hypothetical protein n=1 Tax=Iodobacter sp. CM08 TaxID=3085902 RepID=UPI0029812837|nr:hypothetical protein [Iodobacter sp. CM08]MDW5419271.1 hypothetical protein [Iodobacter sp. CM08]
MDSETYDQKFAQPKIDQVVSSVHAPELAIGQLKEAQKYLVEVRQELREPNANIPKVDAALSVLQERMKGHPSWKEWFLKPVVTNVVVAILSGLVGYVIGKLP